MSGEKRPPEGRDGANNGEKRPRVPPLASVIVQAYQMDLLRQLGSTLEPLFRKVVGEEIESALARLPYTGMRAAPRQIQGARNLRLQFRNKPARSHFTGSKLKSAVGSTIHVMLLDANTGQAVATGPEASSRLDVVVLEGDFDINDEEDWTSQEFESRVVKEREGKRPLLIGDLTVILREGVGTLGDLSFTDNSSWTRCKKFRIGVKIAAGFCEGLRIREAKTEPFIVKDHRGEAYKKNYPPASDDEVWRLENIGKDGSFHKRLNDNGIMTVQDFLKCYMMNKDSLRTILGSNMPSKQWEATVHHAKTCVRSGKLYVYYISNPPYSGVVFNSNYLPTGVIASGRYVPVDSLIGSEMDRVDRLMKIAYENWNDVVEYSSESAFAGINDHIEDPSTSRGYSGFSDEQATSFTRHANLDLQTLTMRQVPVDDLARPVDTGRELLQSINVGSREMNIGFVNDDDLQLFTTGQGSFDFGMNTRHDRSIQSSISLPERNMLSHVDRTIQSSISLPEQNILSHVDSSHMNLGYASHGQQPIAGSFGTSMNIGLDMPQHNIVGDSQAWGGGQFSFGLAQPIESRASMEQFVGPYSEAGTSNLGGEWAAYAEGQQMYSTEVEYIRATAGKFFEQEDVRRDVLSIQSAEEGQLNLPDTSALSNLDLSPAPSSASVRVNVGWLKIRAALRWGIFIRRIAAKKAAERRKQALERWFLEEDEDFP